MSSTEIAPAPIQTESLSERFPHLAVLGFETLKPERQAFYSAIPPDKFHLVQSTLEKEILGTQENSKERNEGETETFQASTIENTARPKKEQANTAIETFHRAENGDPEAKKDLLDQKKELLGEEPTDDEIFQTMLEDQSGMFDNNLVLEVALSDSETQQHQNVLDLYKEFRGDLASVDEVIKPAQQIELFIELTKGGGTLAERAHFARQALTVLTDRGHRNLRDGLNEFGVLGSGALLDSGVKNLREMASTSQMMPEG